MALVVTVIVLIILSALVISTVSGDNGIIALVKREKQNIENKVGTIDERIEKLENKLGKSEIENPDVQTYTLRINYIDGDGNNIANSYIMEIAQGNSYSVASPTIDGYTADKEIVSGIMEDSDVTVIVTYEKIKTLQVGDYVEYTYDSAENYSLSTTISGWDEEQTIEQDTTLKWRVLKIDEENNKIDLISAEPTQSTVAFGFGETAYNNCVDVINTICKEHYSNSTLGIEARSINIKDIEGQLNEAGINARNTYSYDFKELGGGGYGICTYDGEGDYYELHSDETNNYFVVPLLNDMLLRNGPYLIASTFVISELRK